MPLSKEQEDLLNQYEAIAKRSEVNKKTNQPGDVPTFVPPGVEGYDPQSGEVNPMDSMEGKATAFVTGANDLPIVGPAMKAAGAGGAAALTKGIDTLTGGPDDSLSDRYKYMRDLQETSMNTNPGSALAGKVAGGLIVGGGLPVPSGALGAGLVGGGIGAGDTLVRHGVDGELPGATELALQTGMGAAGGIVGHYLGKAVEAWRSSHGLSNTPLSEAAQKTIKERLALENSAGKAMDDSGVIISKDAVRDFADDTMTKLIQEDQVSRTTTPDAWKAVRKLQIQAGKDEDISLRAFNNLRRNIRDTPGVEGSDSHIVNKVVKDMNDFIIGLPKGKPGVVISGDAMKGADAWREMNKFTMEQMRSDALAKVFYKAELEASQRGSGKTLGQALQSGFKNFLTRTGGRAEDELSLFRPHEIKMMEDFVQGNRSVQFDNFLDKHMGTTLTSSLARGAIRLGGAAVKSAVGAGGDSAARASALNLLREGGSSVSLPISRAEMNFSPAAASLFENMSRSYQDQQSRIDGILNAERQQQQQQQQMQTQQPQMQQPTPQPQGFPKATVVPPPTKTPVP